MNVSPSLLLQWEGTDTLSFSILQIRNEVLFRDLHFFEGIQNILNGLVNV